MGAPWRTGRSRHTGTFGTRPAELIAHRGANREAAENSLAAFTRALELDVDGIELDVQLTRDGIPVVHHDPAVAAAAPGAGRERIASLTLSDLQARAEVPTLESALDLVAGRCRTYVEIKDAAAVDAVVGLLSGKGDWAAIHSFDHRVAARVASLDGRLMTGILLVSRLVDTAAAMRAARAHDAWQQAEFIDRSLVDEVHAVAGRVIAWTVNDPSTCRRLLELGVDGVCTDAPREMLSVMNRSTQS